LRPERKASKLEYTIVIEEVSGGDIANILRGYILVKEEKIRFTGIAYGRYGGQNVAPKLSKAAKKRLKEIFGDVDAFEEDLQLRLVGGDFEMKPKHGAEAHSHQHTGEPR
jgi:hypothetical protein